MSGPVSADQRELHAFYASLGTVAYLVTVAAVLAAFGKYTEAIGVGAAITGLFGVMKSPFGRAGVNVEQAGQVGPNGPAPAELAQPPA